MLYRSLACLLLVCLATPVFAQKKAKPQYLKKEAEKAIAESVVKDYVAAEKPCVNYAWAAAVETVLKQKKVAIPQRDWIMKAYGGYKCIEPLSAQAYAGLLRYLDGDYALSPERRIRIDAEFTPGAPTQPDPFIAAFRAGQPLILIWNGKPYVWYGAVYDEYVHLTGNRMFEITELRLLDLLPQSKSAQQISFVKGKDDPGQIDGVIRITVTER